VPDAPPILTPDQRVRVFVSSTMLELAEERAAVRRAVERLHLSPVLFELGARAHPPRSLYLSYLEQSHVFLGIYWQRYGWVAPDMDVSGLEDEWLSAGDRPKLLYVKEPSPTREPRLAGMLERIVDDAALAFKPFRTAEELERLVTDDLAVLLSESFIVSGARAAADAPAATRAPAHVPLPADASSFVGREDDLDELCGVLTDDATRVVTLTGPGGVGKTRLALRAAAQVANKFDEGAVFVGLSSIADPASVPGAIAEAVGVRDVGAESLVDALRRDLADRSMLLVVDNFEHLMPAAEVLAQLLAAAPWVRALVTSREALRIAGEHEFAVAPMAPGDAVELFAQRAGAVRRGFTLRDDDERTVLAICRRVEYVPLAIELAAARTRLLSLDALLERLDHRLDFLAGGARDLPARQQALRATVEWSYDLLTDDERKVFACLGVFVGGFSLAAAQAVIAPGTGSGDEFAVLDALASLVDKSLLRAEPTASEPRFRMLEMVRELAAEHLDASPESAAVHDRHAAWYRALSLEIGAGVRGPEQADWLDVLDYPDGGEAGNVRATLNWYLSTGQCDDYAAMAWALWPAIWINGRLEQGEKLVLVLVRHGDRLSPRARARMLVVSGLFPMWKGEHTEALAVLDESSALATELGDEEVLAHVALARAMLAGPLINERDAEEFGREGMERFRALGDRWGQAAALNALSWLYVAQERFDEGTLLEDTLAVSLAAGDGQFAALAEVNLVECALAHGDVARAGALLASSAARHRALRVMYSVGYLLDAAARLAAVRGDVTLAAVLIGAADHRREIIGVGVWGSQLTRREAFVAGLHAQLGEDAYAAAHGQGGELDYEEALDAALRAG
jgi:predicted ATPase